MEFLISAASGESVTVHSDNWMMAMGKAMAFFEMDGSKMVRWVCTPGPGGSVHVEDEAAAASWHVRPLEMVVKVVAVTPHRETVAPESARRSSTLPLPDDDLAPPPMLTMPLRSSIAPPEPPPPPPEPELPPEPEAPLEASVAESAAWEPGAADEAEDVAAAATEPFRAGAKRQATEPGVFSTESLAERLFDLSMDISGLEPSEACQQALEVILEFVPCEGGAVARGTVSDLVFVAASGVQSRQIVGKTVPYGQGFVGISYGAMMPVRIHDVANDERHYKELDDELGFQTRQVLCVPVMNDEGLFGVVQLLNPHDPEAGFDDEHVEVAQTIARTLATALQEQMD